MGQVQEENKETVAATGEAKQEIATRSKPQEVQTLTLPSGKVAVIGIFKGKHIREATRNADGETDKMIFALIAMTTTIDGKKIVWEDLDEMDGRDVLKLQGAFSTNF